MCKPLPILHRTKRADRDLEECLQFIARQPWGKPVDRRKDILQGYREIRERPERNKVVARRRATGIELRRHSAAQFAIIYAYTRPSANLPRGKISIRAVRHGRVKNVFSGVREPVPPTYLAS